MACSPVTATTRPHRIRQRSSTCRGSLTTPLRSSPKNGYTPNTWKLWCGSAPWGMASASAGHDRPARRRNRWSDPFEKLAAQPVGLHDPRVQWVVQVVGGGDELQVWPGALERPKALTQ